MPNTTSLLSQLKNATPTYVPVNKPLCLLLDDHGYLVTASQSDRTILRFDPNNLTRISQPPSPIFSQAPNSLAHRRGAYYVGFDQSISVVDSSNMSQIHNITTSYLSGTRDMIFLNDGQLMIVLSTGNGVILFFNRSSPTSYNYDFIGYQYVSGGNPHGLFHVDDSCVLSHLVARQHRVLVFEDGKHHSMERDSPVQCLALRKHFEWLSCVSRQQRSILVLDGNIRREDFHQSRSTS